MMTYWWVSTPKATFAVVVRDGIVVDTAAWAKRSTMGRQIEEVLERYRKQKDTQVVELVL